MACSAIIYNVISRYATFFVAAIYCIYISPTLVVASRVAAHNRSMFFMHERTQLFKTSYALG